MRGLHTLGFAVFVSLIMTMLLPTTWAMREVFDARLRLHKPDTTCNCQTPNRTMNANPEACMDYCIWKWSKERSKECASGGDCGDE